MRTNANGGSILTGVHENLSPIFISGGEDETEILTCPKSENWKQQGISQIFDDFINTTTSTLYDVCNSLIF